MSGGDAAAVAAVLAKHSLFIEDRDGNVYCGCDKFEAFTDRTAYRVHVARQITPLIQAAAATAVEEALNDFLTSKVPIWWHTGGTACVPLHALRAALPAPAETSRTEGRGV